MSESRKSISGLLPEAPEPRHWTNSFYAIYGGYSWLNRTPIHYFQSVFTVKDLYDYVSLMSQLKDVEKWGFEALFQRQLKSDRVDAIVAKYLKNEAKTKFFPPITLALMPQSNRGELKAQYDDFELMSNSSQASDGSEIITLSLKGFEVDFEAPYKELDSKFPKIASVCRLKWDSSAFTALAIDGQHRVEALRRYLTNPGLGVSYDVPVILLFIDPDWGNDSDLIKVTREIFIDINKNARPVDDSRLILLDDRNFYNALTRALVAQSFDEALSPIYHQYEPAYKRLNDSPSELEFLKAGIPQELVDITMGRESADINKLKPWNFTSAFILNRAITNNLFYTNDKWAEFELLLESQNFSSEGTKPYETSVAEKRELYSSSEEEDSEAQSISDSEMLSFSASDTQALVKLFLDRYGVLLKATFTSFTPFRKLIEDFLTACKGPNGLNLRLLMIAEGSLEGSGEVTWSSPVAKNLQRVSPSEFSACKNSILALRRPEGWANSIVWFSLFQFALLYRLRILQARLLTIHNLGHDIQEVDALEKQDWSRELFAEIYLRELNFLYSKGLFDKAAKVSDFYVWQGLATKAQDHQKMEGSINAAVPTGEMIHLMICARYLSTRKPSEIKPEHRKSLATGKIKAGYLKVEKESFKKMNQGVSPSTEAEKKAANERADAKITEVFNYVLSLQ